jgi:predicted RNase H-like nuclease (RuvC/YqgF family)
MNIGLTKIRIDGGTQSRVKIDEHVVAQYADDMLNGSEFPPIVLFYDGLDHWLADGFHRYFANKRINAPSISAEVKDGSVRDAILHGIKANNKHGLRPTNEDKRKGVITMLKDIEWQDYSNRDIAEICGVSHTLVNAIRKELETGKPSGNSSTTKPSSGNSSTTTVQTDPAVEFNESEMERETLRAAANTLQRENEELQDKLTVAMASGIDDVEKVKAQSIINDLRAQMRLLDIELKEMRISRDTYQRENSELKKQVNSLLKKVKKLEG